VFAAALSIAFERPSEMKTGTAQSSGTGKRIK
jgi:hypothetical protein